MRGLCVGKFWPYHEGHHFLLSEAQRQCDELHVIVCYRNEEKPEGWRRFDWVKESNPCAIVQLREDVYDQDDSALWARLSIEWLGFVPDVVFTSERYGLPWSREISQIAGRECRHVLVISREGIDLCQAQRHVLTQ